MARERAKKLQAELESSQKDVGLTLKYRHEKETLELENASLRATNDKLRQQHDELLATKTTHTAQNSQLSRDLEAAQKELAVVREELQNLRLEYEILQEERNLISEDHASLERNNETYFKENKSLRAKITSQDSRIRDLEKGIASRDQMIDVLQRDVTQTTDAAGLHEQYTKLEIEIEKLKLRLQRQDTVSREKDETIAALKEENLGLAHEIEKLDAERKQMEDQWVSDRHKNIRLNQALLKNETRYLKHINDHNEDCERREEQCKQTETALAQKESKLTGQMDRRTAAINRVKQLTKEITSLSLPDTSAKPAKTTRIVEPAKEVTGKYTESEVSAKSDAFNNVDDEPAIRINLTEGSDFASIFTDDEIPKLKETLLYLRQNQQQQQAVEEDAAAGNTVQTVDSDLPSLPAPVMRRTRSDETITHNLNKPAGILKKTSHVALDDEFTGRFSVKSGVSAVSMQSNQSRRSAQSHKSGRSMASVQLPHPLRHRRSQSDNARFDAEMTTEQNITSAFFVPDITLHSENHVTGEQSGPSLSKDARRVLDSVCNHKSHNCTVCTRISAHAKKSTCTTEGGRKKTVRVQKPVPVTDRMPEPNQYEEEPTMRPSMPPGHALAMVIKEIEDEIQHLEIALLNKNKLYCSLDKSLGQRERKRVMEQIRQLHRELESKSAIMYKLHDVLEGQKVAGQAMTEAELEVTIASICGHEMTGQSRAEDSWNGFE